MCGIAGVVYRDSSASAESVVRTMLPPLARRGPDAEGFFAWPGVGFGHRRLSIIDLSPAGAQPMLSADGEIGVVFNGCIYNFLEIRRELEQRGHRFRSQCDTEILIAGYREWGIDTMLPKLHGMFAFAIWDQPRRKLTMARDRLGVKPLVYRIWKDGIAFASTLGALQAGGFTDSVNPKAVLEFLDVGFVTDEQSIYTGTSKLPAGSLLEWDAGKVTERVYWTLPDVDESSSIRFEEAVEETERLIIEAVRLRLISDVPIGALLSGGIDSTLVCWGLSKLNVDIRAFTLGTPGDPDDESADARDIAQRLGIPHEVVHLGADQSLPLDELTAAYSEPFGSSSALGMLRVSQAVKPKATVLLTGDGGDDIFLGYSFFYNAWKAQNLSRKLPPGSAQVWNAVRPLVKHIPALRRAQNFLDYTTGGIGPFARVRVGVTYFEDRGMFGELLRGGEIRHRRIPASVDSAKNLLADLVRFQRRMHFTSEFMTKVDGGTMYHSLEARSPFLDHKLWEFAAKLPASIHFHEGRLKAVLREIVRRHVGPDVAFRQKQGFTIPVERWLATKWSSHLRELKDGSLLVKDGWFEPGVLSVAVDDALARKVVPNQLWSLVVFEHWLRRQATLAAQPEPIGA
ncbi:MAG: asparagine synthase (glutamine-hydrolyzing) [Bryobacteraceae bacterium]